MLNQIEQDILNFILRLDYVSAKDITQGTGYVQSTVSNALIKLQYDNLIELTGRARINGFDRNVYTAFKGTEIRKKEIVDPHPLSECWPSITWVPGGKLRKVRGIIHDEAA